MNLDLTGKTALVTGSSRGIGRAIAQALHADGCRVALNSRNASDLDRLTSELEGSFGIAGDVSQSQVAKKVVDEVIRAFGRLDILVCNVGSGQSVPVGQENFDEWQRVFAQNLWSTTNTVEAAKDALLSAKGSIVCISSICGLEVIHGAPVTYSAAKAALHAYVRGIARPLGGQGVRINAIASGNILFEGSVWSKKIFENQADVEKMLNREVPMLRLGDLNDISNLVMYLASPKSAFVTGQVWTLDGGQTRS